MARVTVEDCIEKVKNRFELVLMASRRAKDLERGAAPTVARDNDKSTIIALREIAEETISLDGLQELAKRGLVEEKGVFVNDSSNQDANDEFEEDIVDDDADDDMDDEFDDEDFEDDSLGEAE